MLFTSAKNLNALIYLSFEPYFSYFGQILLNLYKYTYIMGHHIHGQHLPVYADGSVFQDECKMIVKEELWTAFFFLFFLSKTAS